MPNDTKAIDSKAPFRATQAFRIKARLAGNGPALAKSRNAEPGRLGRSLQPPAEGRFTIDGLG